MLKILQEEAKTQASQIRCYPCQSDPKLYADCRWDEKAGHGWHEAAAWSAPWGPPAPQHRHS